MCSSETHTRKGENDAVIEVYEATGGVRHGKSQLFYPSGEVAAEHHFRQGLLDGDSREWYPGGALKMEGFYKDGKKHGSFKFWSRTGKPQEMGKYLIGHRVGIHVSYKVDGSFWSEYDHGEG